MRSGSEQESPLKFSPLLSTLKKDTAYTNFDVGGISHAITGSDKNAQKYALHPPFERLAPPQVPICTPLLFSIIFYYLTQIRTIILIRLIEIERTSTI